MNAVEVIALVVAVLSIIKILFVVVNRKFWVNSVIKNVYGNKTFAVIYVVLILVVGYYLLQALSIVQIFAVVGLSSLLIGLGLMAYGEGIYKEAQRFVKGKISGWIWLYTVIWLALSVWVIYSIFY